MSKSYRVHIHDHGDQGRWLAQADFAKRPTREQIDAAFPVLAEPGRYEVRVNIVSGEDELAGWAWLQGSYAKDPASPTDAELAAAVKRGLADGSMIDASEFLAREAGAEVTRRDIRIGDGSGWLVSYRGQHFVVSEGQWKDEPAEYKVFRSDASGKVTDWDDIASGDGKAGALLALTARPVDVAGRVQSARDVQDAAEDRLPEDNPDGNPYAPYTPEHRVWAKAQEHGKAAASWVFDGNTPQEQYARVLQGIEDGDPEVMDAYRAPDLSGEYADSYSEDDLMADIGWVPHDGTAMRDDLAGQFNADVSAAFWHEVERLACNQVKPPAPAAQPAPASSRCATGAHTIKRS